MSTQRFQILLAAICMLANLMSFCYAQAPIAMENFCKEEGLSDNLSCEKEDGSRECFARSELCNNSTFCKNGLDEGMSQIRLDCDGSLTGRKPDENGEIEPGFLCSSGTILDITQVCDGTADCGSGEDETNLLCANKCRGPYYGGCSHTRECESTPEGATCGNCLPGYARNPSDYTIGDCLAYLVTVSRTYVSEDVGVANVYINLANEIVSLQEDVAVNVSTSDYTGFHRHWASENLDYSKTIATLTFKKGSEGGTRLIFTVPIIDDNIAEYYEQFRVTASVLGNDTGIYTQESHTEYVRVYDNDPFRVAFEHTSYTIMEGGALEVCVVNASDTERVHPFWVTIFTYTDCDNNTADATPDVDYAAEYGRTRLTFSPDSRRECTTIQTYFDAEDEVVEKFFARISPASGLGQVPRPSFTELLIINVQVERTVVQIEQPSYSVSELKNSVEICVVADNVLDRAINVSLQSSYDVELVTLSPESSRSCATFSFPNSLFTASQVDNIKVVILDNTQRVNLGRSITEVFPKSEGQDQCPQLANPLNGQVEESLSVGLIQEGSIATYSCDVGFIPEGTRFRECLNDLTWSGSPTACIQEPQGSLSSSTDQFVLGYISSSPFIGVTTNLPQTVFFTSSSDTSGFSEAVHSSFARSRSISQTSKAHIKAEGKKISVYGWERTYSPSYSYDAFLAFATASSNEVDDYEYYSLPFSNPSSLLIVASEDDTRINLLSSSLTLDRFQSHRIDDIPSFSSMRVTSDKPVSVTSAKSCLGQAHNCDLLVEQVLPTHLWGKTFLVASFSGLKTGETIRIIFSKLSTSVTVTCAESNFFHSTIGRGPGQWVDVELDERGRDRFCIIEANDPVYVVQYARESDGESYMMTIPSIDHYGEFFQGFYTPNYDNPLEFVTIYITPEYFVPGVEGVTVDGVPVFDWNVVRCTNGSACGYTARPLLRRRRHYHTVVHTNPRARLGVSAYGYDTGSSSSFGYPVSLQIPPFQSTNECLPKLDNCGSLAECVLSNGRYECSCNIGYRRVDETLPPLCVDVDECMENPSICDDNANCTNTVGSFFCTCKQGYIGTGKHCTRESSLEEFQDYMPFIDIDLGKKNSESFNNLADDECRPVRLGVDIPIGVTTISQIWICDNGIISLGDRPFKIWRPQLFPSDNPLISQSNVLAVFWNDHQHTAGSSLVSYQIFEKDVFLEVENVNTFMSVQLGATFRGTWMIAISWERATPFLSQISGIKPQNFYQAVIITNFRNAYAMYTYDSRRLNWIGTGAKRNVYSVVGYNLDQRVASSLNNIPSFQNHRLSGTPDVDGISKLNLGERVRWANVMYHIGINVASGQQSPAECKSMGGRDISLFDNLGARLKQGLACPCSINQAFRDRRFAHASGYLAAITDDSRFNSRNCFVQVFRPLTSNRGVHMCCYSTSEETFGALLDTTFGAEASSSLRFHPYSEPDQYVEFDYRFYESCCLYPGGECKDYTDLRKADDCGAYTPSKFAWAWGDPHITTLDGLEYTFNGWGEYTLMEINTPDAHFLLQGRTHPVADSKATQFIGFAFGSNNSTVEVQLSKDNSNFVVLLRGSDITGNVSNTDDIFFSPNQDVFITRDSQSSLTCSFPIGISMTISLSSGMLSFVLEMPDQFQNITQGLMGNNNGIGTDDIVYRNGTMLSQNVSDRLIHDFGQSWQVTPMESLFTYPEGTSAEDYAHPDHVPEFLDEVVSTATVEVLTACGDSVQCIYDASQTGDLNIGLETMMTNEANVVYRQEATNNPPVIVGPPTLLVTLGEEAELVFTVIDDNNLFKVFVVGGLPVNSTLTFTPHNGFTSFTLRWTIFEIVDVSLMFEARDERSAVSVLSVQVQICACQNGGECTLNGLLSSSDRTVVLNCNCPEAYGGRFCAEDYDGCSDIICFSEVACVDQPAPGVGAMCGPCPDGYFGDGEKCIDIDECEDGNHDCSDLCVNNDGGFECDCSSGYTLVNLTDCEDIIECEVLNGDCHHVCNNFDGGFSCSCNEGFELTSDNRTCQVLPESSCGQETICTQNCVRLSGVEVCSCDPGYQLADNGANCLDVDQCQANPCDHNCTDLEGGYLCYCRPGYELQTDGKKCEDIDECLLAAQNNTDLCDPMICSNTDGGFECVCPGGTEAVGGVCVPIGVNIRHVNDSVIGDPLMTVPLYLTNTSALNHIELSENEVVNLCFEIHGRADEYFNLVSDSCMSVNAHYVRAHPLLGYNIINEITVRAVGLDGTCGNIAVRVSGCQAFIDGTVLNGTFSSAGISVRTYSNRVRISLPNCQDLDLVMWVFCERNELRGFPEQGEPDINVGMDLLRFVIARGYNIRETAHGLLGQFWNIPINIERYTGALSDGSTRDDTYILTVNYPDSPPRRFLTFLHSPTWDKRGKEYCLYGGNRQGGGIQELRSPNDPIIEGKYREYIVSGPFDVDFVYTHFESSECN